MPPVLTPGSIEDLGGGGGGTGTVTSVTAADGTVIIGGTPTVAPTVAVGTIGSSQIADGSIVNADINVSAAIAYGKLSLTGAVLNADLAGSIANTKLATNPLARANHTGTQLMATISDAGALATKSTVASADITDGAIVNADVNAAAAIAYSKLSLAASVVNADLATMANATVKARRTAGTGAPEDITLAQLVALGGSPDGTKFLRDDGALAVPPYGAPLGVKKYTTSSDYATGSTIADVDATNLAVTFTAPASGIVIVVLEAAAYPGGGGLFEWGVREGSSTIAGPYLVCTTPQRPRASFYITGISAGSHTYKWAALSGAATGHIYINNSGVNGDALMYVFAA